MIQFEENDDGDDDDAIKKYEHFEDIIITIIGIGDGRATINVFFVHEEHSVPSISKFISIFIFIVSISKQVGMYALLASRTSLRLPT